GQHLHDRDVHRQAAAEVRLQGHGRARQEDAGSALADAHQSIVSRREFLASAVLLPALAQLPRPSGTFVGTVPFGVPGAQTAPLNRLLGTGLDARQFTDLSTISTDRLLTPAEHFFIRTQSPPALPDPASWSVAIGGLVASESKYDLASLEKHGRV